MDADKAIDFVNVAFGRLEQASFDNTYSAQAKNAQKTALAAIEKQIPVKPNPYKGWEGQCPDCGVVFVDRLTKFCGNCGKALDWSE